MSTFYVKGFLKTVWSPEWYNNTCSVGSCRDAWNCLGNMTKEEAMAAYVDEMKLVCFHSCYRPNTRPLICSCLWILAKRSDHWHAVFVVQILEGMPMTDEVEEFLRVLGPFYELIDEKKKISQISDLSTGGVLSFSCSSTLHFVCVWCQKQHVELNLIIICLLSNAQPVWQCLLGNWKASTLQCQYLILVA